MHWPPAAHLWQLCTAASALEPPVDRLSKMPTPPICAANVCGGLRELSGAASRANLSTMATAPASLLVNLDVDDMFRAVRFYTTVFGLHVGRRFANGCVELLGAATPIYLLESEPGSSPILGSLQRRDYSRHWTPVHLDFVVNSVEAVRARALVEGAVAEGPIRDEAYGRIAHLADPFGHGLCIIQFNEQGYDALPH